MERSGYNRNVSDKQWERLLRTRLKQVEFSIGSIPWYIHYAKQSNLTPVRVK